MVAAISQSRIRQVFAVANSPARRRAPNGRSRWTLQMLADELVALEVVESISADTVGRVQKKRNEALA